MNCVICKQGSTRPGHVTVTLQRGETTIVVKQVPAEVCENCGEHYLSGDVSRKLLERAEQAVDNGTEVQILRWAA